jgi:hypothetical protein
MPSLRCQAAVIEGIQKNPEDAPESTKSNWPWFIGYVPPGQGVDNIKGMSGGPIFGFRIRGDELHYRIAAIQSRWWANSRIILGCPVPIFSYTVCAAS